MIKPDPSQSRIKDIFAKTLANASKADELEQLKLAGTPLFTDEDITETSWPLDRLIRRLCVENNITEEYFNERYKVFAMKELGMHPTQASNNRSNLVKALKAGNITYKRFLEVACMVLGFTIENMVFEFADKEGKVQTLEFRETNKAVSNKQKSTVIFKEDL